MDALGAIAELFSWVGLGLGGALFFCWLVVRAADGARVSTEAELVPTPEGPVVRWQGSDGRVYSRFVDDHEAQELSAKPEPYVWVKHRDPSRMRISQVNHGSRVVGILALVFGGVGAVAVVVGLVAMLAG